jgi:hypothetical protein
LSWNMKKKFARWKWSIILLFCRIFKVTSWCVFVLIVVILDRWWNDYRHVYVKTVFEISHNNELRILKSTTNENE